LHCTPTYTYPGRRIRTSRPKHQRQPSGTAPATNRYRAAQETSHGNIRSLGHTSYVREQSIQITHRQTMKEGKTTERHATTKGEREYNTLGRSRRTDTHVAGARNGRWWSKEPGNNANTRHEADPHDPHVQAHQQRSPQQRFNHRQRDRAHREGCMPHRYSLVAWVMMMDEHVR